jgi:hypothetical protein
MRLSRPGGWWFALALGALAAGCDEASPTQGPAEVDSRKLPTFCDRANDEVAELFCGERAAEIASLADLKRELELDRVLLLGHSTALSGRLVSPINPRAVMLRTNGLDDRYTAAAFTRGEQRVELVSLDREANRFRFYLLAFSQACNDEERGCTPGDLFTPAVESDWRELRVQDDEDLKNAPQDCRRCHGGAPDSGAEPMLLMRELNAPWLHWFSQLSTLRDDYEAAKDGEPYAGVGSKLIENGEAAVIHDEPLMLEGQIRDAERELGQPQQPLSFLSGVIGLETTELQFASPFRGPGAADPDLVSSPTWQLLYDGYREGIAAAPPYHHERITDPDKLAAVSAAYRAYLAGDIERDELPDVSDVLPDDPRQLAEMSFAVAPDATAQELLVQACGDCHNASLDPTISRARFDIDLSRVTRATLELASARLERDEDDPNVMPPRGARSISRAQRLLLSAYLRDIDPSEVEPRVEPEEDFSEYGLELGYSYQGAELPASAVVIGDLSGDGRADLVCSPMVFEQSSDGRFEEPALLAASPVDKVALVDVNGDGRLDIVSRGAEPGDVTGLLTFLSEGELETSAGIPSLGPLAADLARGNFIDVDRDGHIDLVTRTGLESRTIVAYRGDGQGAFTASDVALENESEDRWAALTLGDVTGDGEADLVLLQRQPIHALAIYAHDGTGGFEPAAARYDLPASIVSDFHVAIGDANDDGRNDVAISPGIRLMLQNESGGFGAGPLIAINAGPATFFDMNADGLDDIVALASDRGEIRVLLQGARGLTRPAAYAVLELPSTPGTLIDMLEVGDVSEDGCPDVAVARLGSLMVLHGVGCARDTSQRAHR